jgi:hypothetical protein
VNQKKVKQIRAALAGVADEEMWDIIAEATGADMQTDNDGQLIIYTDCYEEGEEEPED